MFVGCYIINLLVFLLCLFHNGCENGKDSIKIDGTLQQTTWSCRIIRALASFYPLLHQLCIFTGINNLWKCSGVSLHEMFSKLPAACMTKQKIHKNGPISKKSDFKHHVHYTTRTSRSCPLSLATFTCKTNQCSMGIRLQLSMTSWAIVITSKHTRREKTMWVVGMSLFQKSVFNVCLIDCT